MIVLEIIPPIPPAKKNLIKEFSTVEGGYNGTASLLKSKFE